MIHSAQDPDELFDVVDAYGMPTGNTKRRADVHRDGDWHRAIHVWIYGQDATGPFVLVQRRGLDKDTWPGKLDAPAAGHLRAGETPEDAYREVEEELGMTPDPGSLVHTGRRVNVSEHPPRWLDHELQDVYLLRDDRPLEAYRPNADELDALVRVPLDAWLELLFEDCDSIEGLALDTVPSAIAAIPIDRSQLIPAVDGYFNRVAVACQRALAGERYLVV